MEDFRSIHSQARQTPAEKISYDSMPLAMKITYVILFLLPLAALLYFILGLPFLTLWKEEDSVPEQIEIEASGNTDRN